jgi:hypothetical protein
MSTRTATNININSNSNSNSTGTSSPSWNPLSVEDAIDRLGYGRFQQRLLVAAGLCSASDAMEILLLSFLAMSVQIEWDLSIQQTNALLSVVFSGAFVGTLGLGILGDVRGRKLAFVVTAATVAIFGVLTCLCHTFQQLLVARFFVGVGIGGSTVPFDTYSVLEEVRFPLILIRNFYPVPVGDAPLPAKQSLRDFQHGRKRRG